MDPQTDDSQYTGQEPPQDFWTELFDEEASPSVAHDGAVKD